MVGEAGAEISGTILHAPDPSKTLELKLQLQAGQQSQRQNCSSWKILIPESQAPGIFGQERPGQSRGALYFLPMESAQPRPQAL